MVNIEMLKKAKKERKMTYEQLSQMSNIPLSTIYDIFRGITSSPRIDTMQAIERALGLTPAFTEEKTGQISTSLPTSSVSLTEKETRLLRAFSELVDEMQDYIIESTETLAAKQREFKGESSAKPAKRA